MYYITLVSFFEDYLFSVAIRIQFFQIYACGIELLDFKVSHIRPTCRQALNKGPAMIFHFADPLT